MKKILPILFTAVFLICMCSLTVSAEGILAFSADGYEDIRANVFAPGGDKVKMLDFTLSQWDVEGDRRRKRHREEDGRICMMCELPNPEREELLGYTSFVIKLDEHAGHYQTLMFGITLSGNQNRTPLSVRITTATGEFSARVWVTPNQWNLVTLDLRDVDSRITGMTVTSEYGEDVPASVMMTRPYMSKQNNSGMISAEKLATNRWDAVVGHALLKTGWLFPDENGQCEVIAPLVTKTEQKPGSTMYVEIHLTGADSGNMNLGILYAGAGEEQREYQRKLSLNAADGVYTIPVEADAEIVSYSLRFENLQTEEGVFVEAIRIYSGGTVPIAGNVDLGRVESITRDGTAVIFAGVMERDAAMEFEDASIHFYAIPGWCADDLAYAVDLGGIEMTTRFRYTSDLEDFGAAFAGDTFRFFAGIPTEDSILPLSHPRYPDAAPLSREVVSNMGVFGGEAVGVFESNASNVMVEIPLETLIQSAGLPVSYAVLGAEANRGVFSVSRSRTVYLNEELLKKLDQEIDFYLSAGIRVYLRLTASSPVRGLTYGGTRAENYAIRATDNESRQMYAALIRTLCRRWNRIAGISLGRGVNYSKFVGDSAMNKAADYAADLAEVCRITYNAASAVIPGIAVIVPYVEYMTDGNQDERWIADRTMAVLLADHLDDIGTIPWILMYCMDSTHDDLTSPVTLSRTLTDLGLDSPADLMIFWQPKPGELTREYLIDHKANGDMEMSRYIAQRFGQLCEDCNAFRVRAVFLSMRHLPSGADYTFYGYLKTESVGDSGRFVYEGNAVSTREMTEHDAVLSLWDFRESHHAMGWIASDGIASCLTDHSPMFSEAGGSYLRSLRAKVDGSSGITLCNFENTLDLRGIEGMDFTVALDTGGENGGVATLVFVIGTEDTRAEYTVANAPMDQVLRFHCDFAGYPYLNAIDYVGVMIYTDTAVTLELENVSVHSADMSAEEIERVFYGTEQTGERQEAYRLAVILCVVTVIMSVALVAAITRHENEERNDPKHES